MAAVKQQQLLLLGGAVGMGVLLLGALVSSSSSNNSSSRGLLLGLVEAAVPCGMAAHWPRATRLLPGVEVGVALQQQQQQQGTTAMHQAGSRAS
jgi:hypothetical protein